MKVLIIEDEKPAAKRITKLVAALDQEINILDVIDSVEDAVAWFNNFPTPDLVFMDIQLADGLSLDIFKKTDVNCPVIFTTAYDEYALEAFKVNSIDYLLKPISFSRFFKAVTKYLKTADTQLSPLPVATIPKQSGSIYVYANKKNIKIFLFHYQRCRLLYSVFNDNRRFQI